MLDREKINNPILKQTKEHELVFDYIEEIDRQVKENNPKTLTLVLRRLLNFLKNDLQNHFDIEEKVFFVAVMRSDPPAEISALVEELRNQHQAITKKLKYVELIILDVWRTLSKDPDKVIRAVKPLLKLLKKHIRNEVTILFPYIDGSPKCKILIEELSIAEN